MLAYNSSQYVFYYAGIFDVYVGLNSGMIKKPARHTVDQTFGWLNAGSVDNSYN